MGSACGVDDTSVRGVGGVLGVGVGMDGQRRRGQPGNGRYGCGQTGVGAPDVRVAVDPGGCMSPGLRRGLARRQRGALVGICRRPRPSPLTTFMAALASPLLAPLVLRVFHRDAPRRSLRWRGALVPPSLFQTGRWIRPRPYPLWWHGALCSNGHTSLSRDSRHAPVDAGILLPDGLAEKASAVPLTVAWRTRPPVPLLKRAVATGILVKPLAAVWCTRPLSLSRTEGRRSRLCPLAASLSRTGVASLS